MNKTHIAMHIDAHCVHCHSGVMHPTRQQTQGFTAFQMATAIANNALDVQVFAISQLQQQYDFLAAKSNRLHSTVIGHTTTNYEINPLTALNRVKRAFKHQTQASVKHATLVQSLQDVLQLDSEDKIAAQVHQLADFAMRAIDVDQLKNQACDLRHNVEVQIARGDEERCALQHTLSQVTTERDRLAAELEQVLDVSYDLRAAFGFKGMPRLSDL